jgi:hypothetical protein
MENTSAPAGDPSNAPKLIAAWIFVGIPFAWGVYVTVVNAVALFR